MSSGSLPSRNPAGHSGLLDNALGLISAVVAFFESRFVLLAQESKICRGATADIGGLRHRGAGALPDGLRFPHRQCCCWPCAFARDLLASGSAGCCAVTFHYRRSAVGGGTQPDHQADVSG